MSDVVMFSGTYVQKGVLFRSAGPHRIATEIRNKGLSCQVILYLQAITEGDLEKICEKFITNDTLMVCFSTTLWQYGNGDQVSNKIKQIIDHTRTKYQKTLIVFGGTSTESYITKYDGDAFFTGYGEQYFIPYLDSIVNKNKSTPLPTRFLGKKKIYDWNKDLDNFHFTESSIRYTESDLIEDDEALPLELSRGCIFKCKFCSYPLLGKKKLNYVKNSEIILEELLHNYENWNITKYVFTDDTFNDNNLKLELLGEIFNKLPFKIQFSTYLRHDLLYTYPHQIQFLKELGLKGTFFGVETFHPKAAKLIGKGLDPEITKDFLYKVKEEWGDDVLLQMGVIAGIPYEDMDSFERLISFIRSPNCPIEGFNINPLTVTNPKFDFLHYKSTFQMESEKYGFSWPEGPDKPYYWTNSIGPVKNVYEADKIAKKIYNAAYEEGRLHFGGISHLPLTNIAKHTKYKTMDNWLKVPRKERNLSFSSDVNLARKIIVSRYLFKLLRL